MCSSKTSEMLQSRPQWRSISLRPTALMLLLLSEIAILVVIIDLWVLSARNTGFVKISVPVSSMDDTNLQSRLERIRPLLWTTLPTLVLTLYRLFREAVISALVVETPFIELQKSSAVRPTKVRRSVYVDYRTSFSIIAWYSALKNGHILLGLCMLFSFVVSLALVPLAGGLFAESLDVLNSNTSINVLSTFDPASADTQNTSRVDYGALLDSVAASWIDDAPYPANTDGRYPLPHIKPVESLDNYTISSTVDTSQLSLDCKKIGDAAIASSVGTNEGTKIMQTSFSANDRDCEISGDILTLTISDMTYLKAFAQTDCPTWAGRTRFVLLYVNVTDGLWEDYKLLSCVPSYWGVNGMIDVTGTSSFDGRTVQSPSFYARSQVVQDWNPVDRQTFENGVVDVASINIAGISNTISRFAELLSRYLAGRGEIITEQSLSRASNVIYSATYTMFCIKYLFGNLDPPREQSGILSISENRLHVVLPVAIAMLIIVLLLVIETVYLIVYLHNHPSMLAEEPIGLVGAANLLHDSNIACVVATCHENSVFDGRLRRPMVHSSGAGGKPRKTYSDDELLDRNCWVEHDLGSKKLKIVVENRSDEEERVSVLHRHTFTSQDMCDAPYHTSPPVMKAPTRVSQYPSPSNESVHRRNDIQRQHFEGDTVSEEPYSEVRYHDQSTSDNRWQSRSIHITNSSNQSRGEQQTFMNQRPSSQSSTDTADMLEDPLHALSTQAIPSIPGQDVNFSRVRAQDVNQN